MMNVKEAYACVRDRNVSTAPNIQDRVVCGRKCEVSVAWYGYPTVRRSLLYTLRTWYSYRPRDWCCATPAGPQLSVNGRSWVLVGASGRVSTVKLCLLQKMQNWWPAWLGAHQRVTGPSKMLKCQGHDIFCWALNLPNDHMLKIEYFGSLQHWTAENLAHIMAILAECRNQNFGKAITCHRSCWIEWNATVVSDSRRSHSCTLLPSDLHDLTMVICVCYTHTADSQHHQYCLQFIWPMML